MKANESFKAVPLKTAVRISVSAEAGVLFDRFGDTWELAFDPDCNNVTVPRKIWHKCSLAEKTVIAGALPELYTRLLDQSAQRRKDLLDAHRAMDALDELIKRQKEGE